MARPAGQILQRGAAKWLIGVYLGSDGGHKRCVGKTVQGARKDVQRVLTAVLHDRDTGTPIKPMKITVGAYLAKWLEGVRPNLSPVTVASYEATVRVHPNPTLGHVLLDQLGPVAIRTYVAQKMEAVWHLTEGFANQRKTSCSRCEKDRLGLHGARRWSDG